MCLKDLREFWAGATPHPNPPPQGGRDPFAAPAWVAMASEQSLVTIADGLAEAAIAPWLGAGLAWYDLTARGKREPLFRPCRDPARAHPYELANILLTPYSNRISGGGFAFGGAFHAVAPNVQAEPVPCHGDGFSSAWTVEKARSDSAALRLEAQGHGPWRYRARVVYALEKGALTMRLEITNLGDKTLPFGLGLHPWLVRTPQTTLQAKARRVVLENSIHLPAGDLPVEKRKDWNFAQARRLPGAWINNAFLGWDGWAEVAWIDRGLTLDITTDPPLSTYILHSPDSEADHFCFEPVTHPVDAFNLPGGPEANGLKVLAPGEETAISARFTPRF